MLSKSQEYIIVLRFFPLQKGKSRIKMKRQLLGTQVLSVLGCLALLDHQIKMEILKGHTNSSLTVFTCKQND